MHIQYKKKITLIEYFYFFSSSNFNYINFYHFFSQIKAKLIFQNILSKHLKVLCNFNSNRKYFKFFLSLLIITEK